MKEMLEMLKVLKSAPDEISREAVQFFYYISRSALEALLTAYNDNRKPQMQQLAHEDLETIQAWLNEELQS
jgi:hypothetical protein